MLRRLVKMRFRIRKLEYEPSIVELEKKEYNKLVTQHRKQNIEIFWDMQRVVENKFIGKNNKMSIISSNMRKNEQMRQE